jgi:hypothetical protein
MSDRTTLHLNYAECDREAIEVDLGQPEDETVENCIVNGSFNGVDGGGSEELGNIAALGLPCYGHYESGAEYCPGMVATCSNRFRDAVAGCVDGTIAIDFHLKTGRVVGLAQARRFARFYNKAVAAVEKRAKGAK